jgi:nitrogen fixation protein FixH
MFWLSLQAPTDLVAADYYARSKRVDEALAAQAASRATGWRASLTAGEGGSGVALRIVDQEGRPLSGLSGTASAYRPSDAALDQPLSLAEDPAQTGTYRLMFGRPARGLWEIEIELQGPAGHFTDRLRWFAE